ncbi:MAG TPA: TAT-variant-translocated molybdopterin oxidoreductase [Chthonomonadaceae bacterium]|nr:TAT-variant-translocated molybdopterin oxidoreductase [Chthonomonadaceae bacterium]
MDKHNQQPLDLTAIRKRLESKQGPQYWRSLEELAETPEFQKFLEDEFPHRASLLDLDRRQFLTLMGASLALAGLSGCRYMPQEKIVPYVQAPEDRVLGVPAFYASAMPFQGYGLGLLARSNEGRPTKIEGNPDHPASMGAANVFMQASVLNLYDPDRSQNVTTQGGDISSWDAFLRAASEAVANQRASGGAGLRILTETITSPTLAEQLQNVLRAFPAAKWHQYEPVNHDNIRVGSQLAFGEIVNTIYHFDKADRILSLDSDFLLTMPGSVRYAWDFGNRRRVRTKAVSPAQPASTEMNRLYMVESTATITGAKADHRLPMRAGEVEAFARAVAQQLGVDVGGTAAAPASAPADWIAALVKDLQEHRGRSVVIAGEYQSPAVHALAHAMNAALGNVGATVTYTAPVEANPTDQLASLRDLVGDMQAGKVQMLVILGGNPVFNAPADLDFEGQLTKVPFSVHLSLYQDETSAQCRWHVPEAHYLEAWSDVRAYDGTASIIQPLIAPLYEGKSAHELLGALFAQARPGYDILRDYWARQNPTDFDRFWEKTLNSGVVAGTQAPVKQVTLKPGLGARLPAAQPPTPDANTLEIVFRPDPTIWDGRWANNGWLQELPKPLTKLVWDNGAILSPATAERLNVTQQRNLEASFDGWNPFVELAHGDRKLKIPVFVLPGHPDNVITLYLGYGRTKAGQTGNATGFDTYQLRTSDALWAVPGVSLNPTGDKYQLASTHYHNSVDMQGRDPVRFATLEEFKKEPDFLKHDEEVHPSENTLYDQTKGQTEDNQRDYNGFGAYSWGMSIDNNACISCNACVTACQAENNIPVVGKDQVIRGREMHWIRIDRYFEGGLDNPRVFFQPVPCMHCELAPCEPVCPVGATVHSHEGLNQMVYNRCVGTRYCSNNCPYKVRRFNFLNYANDFSIPVLNLVHNPDVTVRSRGVMEKCSYCVQRINAARIEAKKDNREIRDGEVQTACQQTCPTQAIVFGDISRPANVVAKLKAEPHDYSLLGELNTRPRTTYLAALGNPNPEIKSGEPAATKS